MVWRADRPAKGRYREFLQMDADIIDDDSVLADTETLLLANYLMETLGAKAAIQFNCRPMLNALIETCGLDQAVGVNLMRIIDKFNKIGQVGVASELTNAGFSSRVVNIVDEYLGISGSNNTVLQGMDALLGNAPTFRQGFDRLSKITGAIEQSGNGVGNFVINPAIARGLDYYTGVIFETILSDNPDFGNVCSGGRYDCLIKHLEGRFLPSIGLSIGIDRLFAAMESVNKVPSIETTTQVFIVNFGESFTTEYLKLASELRHAGVAVEIFSRPVKIAKQIKIASNKNIPLVLLAGPDEISRSQVLLKEMRTGVQTVVQRNDVTLSMLKCLDSNDCDKGKEVPNG
jgi:histidyl-tRNA synthetase